MMADVMKAVVCLYAWLSVCQVSSSYIPPEMNLTLQNLKKYYNLSYLDRFDGKHVFSRAPLTGKIESKMLYMGGILEAYEELIEKMLKQPPALQTDNSEDKPSAPFVTATSSTSGSEVTGEVRPKLIYILEKIKFLKKHRYQEQVKILHGLKGLMEVQMNNTKVQSRALWELPWIFEEASSLADNIMRRRRRRQARTKLRLRA